MWQEWHRFLSLFRPYRKCILMSSTYITRTRETSPCTVLHFQKASLNANRYGSKANDAALQELHVGLTAPGVRLCSHYSLLLGVVPSSLLEPPESWAPSPNALPLVIRCQSGRRESPLRTSFRGDITKRPSQSHQPTHGRTYNAAHSTRWS